MPAFQSIVPSLVERERLGPAYALNSAQFNLARVAGPALAGLLLASVGAVACFAANTLSYLPFILAALWILPRRSRAPVARSRSALTGYREVLRSREQAGALATVLATGVLCGPIITFAPVLVKDVLHAGAGHFGGALSAFGVGGLGGAIVLLALEGHVERRLLCSWCAGLLGLMIAAAALARSFAPLVGVFALGGAAMTMSNTSANSILQSTADDRRRGATASLYMIAMRGGLALGNLATGAAAKKFGMTHVLIFDGALAVVAQLIIGLSWATRAEDGSNQGPTSHAA